MDPTTMTAPFRNIFSGSTPGGRLFWDCRTSRTLRLEVHPHAPPPPARLVEDWWLVVGGWWLVVSGWWLVVGGWWLVVGGWWLVVGGSFKIASFKSE